MDGAAILNFDNKKILDFKNLSKAKVTTYGFEEGADIYASDFKIIADSSDLRNSEMYYRIEYMGTSIPFQLKNIVGKSYAYAILCAMAVGIYFDMNLVQIAESLKLYKGVKNRINILRSINNSWLIDDTYNASPLATLSSLGLLSSLPAKRYILAIGDMKELGKYSEIAHRQIGDAILSNKINLVFSIGQETKFIDQQLVERGFEQKNIHHFDKSEDAIKSIYSLIQPGDLILIKGSHSTHMEKISEALAKII
jgi:UDP-N-acetylmuramoyl-tripeptide--D-alanyl-D-alanine ligase